jgi:small acid-soluble spore protein I (minor)
MNVTINLRQAVLKKIQDKSSEEIAKIIDDSVGGDEMALPGLGVLFEVIWENSEQATQQTLSDTLKNHLVKK